MATTLRIDDWYALELAFSFNAPEHRAYLDLHTGRVQTLHTDEGRDEQALRDVEATPGRYRFIDPVPPREQRRWMVKFAASVQDGLLRGRLDGAISAPGAFRQFKDILHANTEEWRRWRRARAALIQAHIQAWFAEKDLALDEPPPWQMSRGSPPPGRDEEHDHLRHVARDQIGRLSPAGIELIVAYLRHVHWRHGTGG